MINTEMNSMSNNLDLPKMSRVIQLSILLFPFLTFVGSHFSISVVNISNLFSIFLFALVLYRIMQGKYRNSTGYIIFFFLMILYALLSITWSKYGNVGITIIFPLFTCFFALAFISSLNENEFELFIKSFSLFTVFVLILSLIEIFTGRYFFFNNIDFIYNMNQYGRHYPGVVFSNPNDLAQYLLVGFPLLVFGLLQKKRIMLSILFFAVTIFILVNSSSRIGLISAVIIMGSYLLLSLFKKNHKTAVFIIAIAALFILLPNIGIDLSQYDIIDNFLRVDSTQDYFTGRDFIYSQVLQLGLDNIFFGSGLGGSYSVSGVGPHNMFLFILADLGVFFAVGFIIALIYGIVSMYRYKTIQVAGLDLVSIVLSILIVFPLFSSMSSGNEQRKIVWIAMGVMIAVINNVKERSKNV